MRPFFVRWLARSFRGSLAASAVSTASLALSAALVFTLVAVSAGVESRLGRELAAYGANLLVLPRMAPLRFGLGSLELGAVEEERFLRPSDLARLPANVAASLEATAPGLVQRARIRGREVGAAGYALDALRRLNPLWRVAPDWPGEGEAMAGATLAAQLQLEAGETVEVSIGERSARVRVAAVVETGGAEDENLFLPLSLLQELAGRPDAASLVLIRARIDGGGAEAVSRALEAALPGAEARTLRQVAQAEEALLGKVRRLLWLVTLALGAATAFTVSGTLGVLLLGRRQEIGLCLALGASPGRVRALLLAEAATLGTAGGALGCLVGAAASQAVAHSVFGETISLAGGASLWALGAALGIALAASAWPVERAIRVSPCDTLRTS